MFVRNSSEAARRMTSNIRNMSDTTFTKFMDDVADAPVGSKIRVGDRTYTLGGSKGQWTLADDAIEGSTMRLSQLSDDLTPTVTVKNGTPRISADEFSTKIRSSFSESGQFTTAAQLDQAVKATTQQVFNNPAVSRINRINDSAQAADAASNLGGRKLSRAEEGALTQRFALSRTDKTPNVRQLLREVNANVLDGAVDNVLQKVTNKKPLMRMDASKQLGTELVSKFRNADSNGRWGSRVKGFISKYQADLLAGISIAWKALAAVRTTLPTAAAAAATASDAGASEEELRYDTFGMILVEGALAHQQDVNGCWMYDKLRGTLTKVKLLSCGQVSLDNAMDTCATQNYAPGLDASIRPCSNTVFNPCLKNGTQRTLNSATPAVPNVCSTYLYNTTAPASVSGVTAIDACAGVSADQTCSSYCKAEHFDLPEYVELICVNMDFPTAYADFMSQLGYNPTELFSSVNNATRTPPSPAPKSKTTWIVVGVVAGLVILGAAGYVYLSRRRQKTFTEIQ